MTSQDRPEHEAAFSALYRDHFEAVLAWLLRKAVPPRDAVDVVQLVFIAAWEHRSDIPAPPGEARAWLLATANNQLLNYRRRQIHAKLLPEDVVPCLADEQLLAEQRLIKGQLITKAIDAMEDGPNRAAFVGVYIEGKTTATIATETGVYEGSVRSALSRGRAEFREIYERLHGERDDLDALDAATLAVVALLLFSRVRIWGYVDQILGLIEPREPAGAMPRREPSTRSPWRRLAPALAALPLLLPSAPHPVLPEAPQFAAAARAAEALHSPPSPPPVTTPLASTTSRRPSPRKRTEQQLEDSRETERNMLQQAASLLVRKEPRSALVLLREHARRYPESRLAEQRDSYTRQAMIALGERIGE
ncbi:RNA polymerase sigma factor [Polyangium sp. 15x6]|uniref:RNA polymerase sigma factor n=1 Tax=Polyangium sp. 15x6 TaxID=3042687 RepID=UPI00249CBD25|nr:RNA polymerase sigma factor [Polyangium sp. 15x6]MDI3287355.1 RNA polymerase sigma factor [Polyangium sp. 15x6]